MEVTWGMFGEWKKSRERKLRPPYPILIFQVETPQQQQQLFVWVIEHVRLGF
jgi:hypothetical protein